MLEKGGKYIQDLFSSLSLLFETVTTMKPRASRVASLEAFIVYQRFHMPKSYKPQLSGDPMSEFEADKPLCSAFVAFGDLSGFDKHPENLDWQKIEKDSNYSNCNRHSSNIVIEIIFYF